MFLSTKFFSGKQKRRRIERRQKFLTATGFCPVSAKFSIEECELRNRVEIGHSDKLFAEDKVGGFGYQPFLRVRVTSGLCDGGECLAAFKVGDRIKRRVVFDGCLVKVGVFEEFKHVPSRFGADAFAVAGDAAFRPQEQMFVCAGTSTERFFV